MKTDTLIRELLEAAKACDTAKPVFSFTSALTGQTIDVYPKDVLDLVNETEIAMTTDPMEMGR